MARGAFPSMTALLGLLAVAGYQNRDKLAELLGGRKDAGSGDAGAESSARPAGLDAILGRAGGGLGSVLGGGLKELAGQFRQNGHADAVESWVKTGPNKVASSNDLEHALGSDVMDDLIEHTGLSREELLARLTRELPDAVDKYTPDGRVPTDEDVRTWPA